VVLAEMARMVAHEVRNALSVLYNVSSGLRRSLPDLEGDPRMLLEILEEEVARLDRLSRDLVALGSPAPSVRAQVVVSDLLSHAVAEARSRAREGSDVPVSIEVPGAAERVSVDPARMLEALAGIVHNALEASAGRGGGVRVAATFPEGRLRVDVVDCGLGIPPEDGERIFEPFYSTKPAGLGLSLALCRQIARSHGGEVRAFPAPDGPGTGFRLEIPLEEGTP
jgi:two-component system sensor histidine kinase AtoS